jgi:hypothetical protein
MMWSLLLSQAAASGASLYAGLGLYSWRQLRIDADPGRTQTLYRNVTARAELYGSAGLTERLTVSFGLPLVYSRVLDDPELGACEGGLFPCAPILTVGTASLSARHELQLAGLQVAPGVVLLSSSWNARTRGYYNTVGEATTDVGPSLRLSDRYGTERGSFSWTGSAIYTFRTTFFQASAGAPHDDVRAGLELEGQLRPVSLGAGLSTYQRLGGIEVASLLGTDDRWAVSDYDNVSAQGKLSVALREGLGLHLSVSRVLWVRNGPPDALDVSVGLNRWFAPR